MHFNLLICFLLFWKLQFLCPLYVLFHAFKNSAQDSDHFFFLFKSNCQRDSAWHEVAKDIYCQYQNVYQENHQILEGGCFCRNWNVRSSVEFSPKILPGRFLFSTVIGTGFKGNHKGKQMTRTSLRKSKHLGFQLIVKDTLSSLRAWDVIVSPYCWWPWLKGPLKMASRERAVVWVSGRWEATKAFLWHLGSVTAINFWEHGRCAGKKVEFLHSLALTGTLHNCNEMSLGLTVSLYLWGS